MISEAIILAGGLGTRLRDAVPDLPKCMAPVAGHPFLYYIIRYLESQGVKRFVFSLGYRHDVVEDFLRKHFPELDYKCVIEISPLKTGGAIKLALTEVHGDDVLVMNGDTLFKVGLKELEALHLDQQAECCLLYTSPSPRDRTRYRMPSSA